MTMKIDGIFSFGQINGTTGYEESIVHVIIFWSNLCTTELLQETLSSVIDNFVPFGTCKCCAARVNVGLHM